MSVSNASDRLQALAKSLRRSSGGGGVVKVGEELDMSLNEPSPPLARGKADTDDKTDAESIVFMEQGRQLYDTSRARENGAAASAAQSKVRPTTAKSGVSGNIRPSSAYPPLHTVPNRSRPLSHAWIATADFLEVTRILKCHCKISNYCANVQLRAI